MSRGITRNEGYSYSGASDDGVSDADYLERIKELDLELFGDLLDDRPAPNSHGSDAYGHPQRNAQPAQQSSSGSPSNRPVCAPGRPQHHNTATSHSQLKKSMSRSSKVTPQEGAVNGASSANGSCTNQGSFASNALSNPSHNSSARAQASVSYFYIIQLIPEALPNRVKLGVTNNMNKTITDIRIAAPTAVIVKQWRCKAAWTQTALDSITSIDCQHVLNDIFEGNIKDLVDVADNFFKLMPKGDKDIPLSEHSPLKSQYKSEASAFRHADLIKSYQ